MSSPRFNLSLADLELQVLAFEAVEIIGQPYSIDLHLVSRQPDLDLAALLRQPAWLDLGQGRGLHGLVWRIEQTQCTVHISHYRIELRPALAWLEQRRNCRIYQHKSVPQILRQLLAEHGIQGDACQFPETEYPAREYCVQYAESDLHFLRRLCEEEGLHYHFRHSAKQGHVLVFGDDQTVFPRLCAPQPFRPDSGQPQETPAIQRFTVRLESRSDTVTLRDHDERQPRLQMQSSASQADTPSSTGEQYHYPGRFTDRSRGTQLARRALEGLQHDALRAEGSSSQPLLASGHFLELQGHPRDDFNQLWLLTEVHHQGYQPQVLEAFAGHRESAPADPPGYRNRFVAIPWQAPYRLPCLQARPSLLSAQTAVVTGPDDEDIHCDEHGRVQVRFHWEREAAADTHSRAWLRVASGWADGQYGALLIPRVGMEVLVSFLDGDPDRPLVTGCLYHAEHEPPCPLPDQHACSVFRTRSSPGGEGFHELRIDDRQGAERIHVHAQRDWEQHINHDHRLWIGNQRHCTVAGDSHSALKGKEHRITHGNRLAELRADDHLTVQGSQHLKLGAGQFIEAGQEIHLASGEKIVLQAGSELTLKVGGSFVKLDASGVTLVGAQVRLNSGGSAGKGAGAQPLLPQVSETDTPPAASERSASHQAAGQHSDLDAAEPGERTLIVDVWGDPALGSQLQLLDPKDQGHE